MTGVKVTIGSGTYLSQSNYSVTEDSTPVDPSDTTGGVGQFTVGLTEDTESQFLVGKQLDLEDGSQGTTVGTVSGVSVTNGDVTVTADSRLGNFTVRRTAQPFSGTLQAAFTYYLGLVGITGGLVVDSSIAARAVIFPGWTGNCWDYMKQMATSQQVEISLVSDNVVLRPLRGRLAENYRDSSVTWNLDSSQQARSVEIYYYNNTYVSGGLAYPVGGWNEDVPVFTVNAGETVTYDLPLSSSLTSVDQPTCVSSVDRYYTTSSVYSVTGAGVGSDLPIAPAQWAAGGGSLTVAINPDTTSLTVTITGSSETQYAPYRIAMTAGPSDSYSSLRIIGTGVFFDKQLLTLNTGVDTSIVSEEVGAVIDNPFISTLEQAYHSGFWALKRYGASKHSINVATSGINRVGDSGSYRYPTVAEFDALYAGDTVADFNVDWSAMTVDQFNEYMRSLVQNDFTNQAFGNVAGARVRRGDAYFRIRSANIAPAGITYSAEEDTTIADFNTVWAGATIADFNEFWAGRTLGEFAVPPLMFSNALTPGDLLYPSDYIYPGNIN